jgi:glutamine synthetase
MIVDYVWIGGNNMLYSKIRVINDRIRNLSDVPLWTFDRSSTLQGETSDSEGYLYPRRLFKCPFRKKNGVIVLCDTYNAEGNPLKGNNRENAEKIFDKYRKEEFWFGFEQEFFLYNNETNNPIGLSENHYCGVGNRVFGRKIVEEHLDACICAGVKIVGINAEVAPSQWEFQILGEGIESADHLWMARYLLDKICEKYNCYVKYHPKPLVGYNGSGCHVNISTRKMREKDGIGYIMEAINKIRINHSQLIEISGENNNMRLTGTNETSDYNKFSYGIGSRDTSIRIPFETVNNKSGYFEHRIYGANIDPYLVISKIAEIVIN